MNEMMGQDAKSLFGFGGVLSAFLPLVIGSLTKLMGG
jgi:hypothetical protein